MNTITRTLAGALALTALGLPTLALADDAAKLARGNMDTTVSAMDTNHDGMITREEFLKYQAEQFDKMKKTKDGMVMKDDMLIYLRAPGS